jgi:hypothetical protein
MERYLPAVLAVGVVLVLGAGTAAGSARVAAGGDSPAGFWYGTDSPSMIVGGNGPYGEPVIGGSYGGYFGMVGSWEWWLGCPGAFLNWSQVNSAQADANLLRYHRGVGAGAYWFMGGPGVDPHYNGSAAEARAWGSRQAARALADIAGLPSAQRVRYPVLFMDIELPGISPAPDNGWNSVYTSPCSGVVRAASIPAALDRAEFNGFWDYVRAHSQMIPGVYSAPVVWAQIFGSGAASQIPNTDEWTYEPETGNLALAPAGWCLRSAGSCAQFFGGVSSASVHALVWQFSGGGGVRNAYGDFDQIDAPALGASLTRRRSAPGRTGARTRLTGAQQPLAEVLFELGLGIELRDLRQFL